MLHSTNIQMLQKHLKVATFEGSFKSNIHLCTRSEQINLASSSQHYKLEGLYYKPLTCNYIYEPINT